MVWSEKKPITIKKPMLKIQTDDDFNSVTLHPQWEWNYQPRNENWTLMERDGYLRLYAFQPIRPQDKIKLIFRSGNTLTQRSFRSSENEVIIKMEISAMADGQYAGLTHYASSYSTFGVIQQNGVKTLSYDNNGNISTGIKITVQTVWLKSSWGWDGISTYSFSLNGKTFTDFGDSYQLSWGNHRGDRVGIFNYNILANSGSVDVDYFHYKYNRSN